MDKPIFILVTFLCLVYADIPEDHLANAQKKFEFKHSFKPPMLVNTKGEVPFWQRGGDAIPTDSKVRVAPSIQDRRGWLWTKNEFDKRDWTIDVDFSITGKHTFGADGMAFWYTASKGFGGSTYGNTDSFVGLAVVIDTFDNNGMGDSPKIGVYISDGSLRINQGIDGQNQDRGHCVKYIRNKRYSTKLKIVYFQQRLEIWVNEGDTDRDTAFEQCLQLDNIELPTSGYFGISAATGGLSDDHDVKSFLVHSLITNEEYRRKMIEKYDQKKMEQVQDEYRKQSESFDTKKSQYRKQHKQDEVEWEKRLEMEENVQIINDMHHSLRKNIKEISQQVDSLKAIGGGGGGSDTNTVLAAEGRMTQHLQELRSQIEKVSAGVGNSNNRPKSEQMQPLYEIQANIKQLLAKIEAASGSGSGNADCPSSTTCLSTWFFIMAMLVQSSIVFLFIYYKQSQERNAKKFF